MTSFTGNPFDTLHERMSSGPVVWSAVVRELAGGSPRALGRIGDGRPRTLLAHEPERILPTASMGKILLLLTTSARIEAGRLHERDVVDVLPEDDVAESGLLRHLCVRALPVADLGALVGAVSDNLATNVLLRLVGLDEVRALTRRLDVRGVALHDRVRDERTPQDPPHLSTASAGGLAELVLRLHRGHLVSPAVCARVVDWLRLDTDTSMVAGPFGVDPLCHVEADRGLRLWHKTGTNLGVRADGGLVEGPRGAVTYAVVASWAPGLDGTPVRDDVLGLMGDLGRAIRGHLESVN